MQLPGVLMAIPQTAKLTHDTETFGYSNYKKNGSLCQNKMWVYHTSIGGP